MPDCTLSKSPAAIVQAKHHEIPDERKIETSDERKIHIVQSKHQIDVLSKNNWTLQFAKGVKTADGDMHYNIVWRSKPLQHHNVVIWTKPVYALNWTIDDPKVGSTVCVGGVWQEVEIDSVWDLAEDGYWTTSDSAETKGYIGVGEINYHREGVPGIHVVIGMKIGESSHFTPIFVDPTALQLGSSSIYQPKEKAVWWYATPQPIGTKVQVEKSIHGFGDFCKDFYICSTYDTKKWTNNLEPPAAEEDPEPVASTATCSAEFPFTQHIIFTPAIKSNLQPRVAAYLIKKLSGEYTDVKANFRVENNVELLQVILKGRKNTKRRNVSLRNVVADISASIRGAEGANEIPKTDNEVWRFIN